MAKNVVDIINNAVKETVVDKFTDGAIEAIVYCYENDMIDVYQVEDLLDYFSANWANFIPQLTVTDQIEEAVEFMQENGHE